MLPVTSPSLYDATSRPYFLWWVDTTIGEFRRHLESPSVEIRVYWLGALLREANTRDVWLFTSEREIRELWPHLVRYLGRARERWAFLLGLPPPQWPPPEAHAGQ